MAEIYTHTHTSTHPNKRTLRPIVTGSSVIGLKYKDGVMLCCDTLASYGSMAKHKDVQRVEKIGEHTLLMSSGELSDFQFLTNTLKGYEQDDFVKADGHFMSPKEYCSLVSRILYGRRCKFNPLWMSCLLGGYKDDAPFLGYVDMYGTTFHEDYISTGFGAYFATPLLRQHSRPDMSEADAKSLLETCMRILFYRDCQSYPRIQIAKATAAGVTIEEPYVIQGSWACERWNIKTSDLSVIGNSW